MALVVAMSAVSANSFPGTGNSCLQRSSDCRSSSNSFVVESLNGKYCCTQGTYTSRVELHKLSSCHGVCNVHNGRSGQLQGLHCQWQPCSLWGEGCGAFSALRGERDGGKLGFRTWSNSRRRVEISASKEPGKKKGMSFGDQLLDYIEGGPKLRKWYGAGELLPRDGAVPADRQQEEDEGEVAEDVVRDAVLVTDADGPTGQLVVLSLILRRARVRALVRDVKAAVAAFGPYVEPVLGDVNDGASVDKALKGVRAVISPSKLGLIAERAKRKKVEHVVLLSQVGVEKGAGEGWGAILGALTRRQLAEAEAEVAACGVPYTIVRAGVLRDEPGGKTGFEFGQGDMVRGAITREDAATVCVRALDAPPDNSLVFEVVNGKGKVSDWGRVFESLTQVAPTTNA